MKLPWIELKNELKQLETEKTECEKQLSHLERNLTKVTSKPTIERISEEIEILDSKIKTKASEIYSLKKQQENLKQLDPESEVLAEQLANFSAIFGRLTFEEKKTFLRHTVEKIVVKQFDPKKAVQLTSKHQIVALKGKSV